MNAMSLPHILFMYFKTHTNTRNSFLDIVSGLPIHQFLNNSNDTNSQT